MRMLFYRALLTCLFILSHQALAVDMTLGVGQQEALNFEALATSVSVEKPGIVGVSKGDSKSVVILSGKAEGTTSVSVSLQNGKVISYEITVTPSARSQLSSYIERLRRSPGVTLDARGTKYAVSGQFRNRNDQNIFSEARRRFPGVFIDGTDPDIVESNAVVRTINRVLEENDIGNIQAHAYGQIIALEGSPRNESQKNLALRIARMISAGVEDHISTDSNGAPPIAIEVLFIESSKTNRKQYGVNGPQNAFAGLPDKGAGIMGTSISSYSASRPSGKFNMNWQVGPLTAFLRLQQTKSNSRVVSNPKLVARSGQKAQFESGGSFFIPAVTVTPDGGKLQSFTQEQTGIQLSIEPRIDAIGQIDSKIKTSIIEIGERARGDAPPSLIRSNLETSVTIRNGQSILLSGLTLKKSRKNVSRVPLLADIPIIGELFKERDQEFEEKEIAVIVTMTRVSASEGRAQAADQLLETSDSDVSFSIFD